MTKATEKAEEKVDEVPEEETAPEVLEPAAWLTNGCALFIGTDSDVCEKAEAWFQQTLGALPAFYYVVGVTREEHREPDTKYSNGSSSKGKVTYTWTNKVFKVINNLMGRAIIAVEGDECELADIEEKANFNMPKLPWELVQKLDAFFRYVDKKHDAESIVILTYDPMVGGEEGWGFIVPVQKNSSVSCKYEPDSIVDELDDLNEGRDFADQVFVAGSAHSHPGMSAYASHTDHGDQVNNDGLHMTAGWTAAKPTEWYIEFQMGGGRFELTEEQTFSYVPEPPQFPDIEKLAERVATFGSSSAGGTRFQRNDGKYAGQHFGYRPPDITLPPGCPDLKSNTVVVRLMDSDGDTCPVCTKKFRDQSVERRRCMDCMVFLVKTGEGIKEVLEIRKPLRAPSPELENLDKEYSKPNKPIALWDRWEVDGNILETVETLWHPDGEGVTIEVPGKV